MSVRQMRFHFAERPTEESEARLSRTTLETAEDMRRELTHAISDMDDAVRLIDHQNWPDAVRMIGDAMQRCGLVSKRLCVELERDLDWRIRRLEEGEG